MRTEDWGSGQSAEENNGSELGSGEENKDWAMRAEDWGSGHKALNDSTVDEV